MSFLNKVQSSYKVESTVQIKNKRMPKKLLEHLSYIKSEIKKQGYAPLSIDLGGDAQDDYFIVPIKFAEELAKGDKGKFAKELTYGDRFNADNEPVYLDVDLKLAWQYRGIWD